MTGRGVGEQRLIQELGSDLKLLKKVALHVQSS